MRKGELEDCFPPASGESGSVRWRYKVILREDLTSQKSGKTWQGRVGCVCVYVELNIWVFVFESCYAF